MAFHDPGNLGFIARRKPFSPRSHANFRTWVGYLTLRLFGRLIVPAICARDSWRTREAQDSRAISAAAATQDTLLIIVVPDAERRGDSWKSGGGNYFFELLASARDRYGDDAVDVFVVNEAAPSSLWHAALTQFLVETNATHCVAFIESDPAQAGPWHWQNFAALARRSWNGAFVGILTDGLYLLHQARATRFRHAYPRSSFVAIDIDESRHAGFVPKRTLFGPCFLPISDLSIEALRRVTSHNSKHPEYDVVFVGKVYSNREGLLEELRSSGLRVGVNPHRTDPTIRSGYGAYVRGLRMAHFTLNLSEAGGIPIPQLKSRMLEGPLFGTIVCSDESKLARHFFDADDFVNFKSVEDLKSKIVQLLSDPTRLNEIKKAAGRRAQAIASDAFWSTVDRALAANNLPLPIRRRLN